MMGTSKKVTELDLNTSPKVTDLVYVARVGAGPSWADKKVVCQTLKDFVNVNQTEIKGGSYTIQASECDKRWFSNGYATGEISFALPAAVDGMEIGIFVESSYTLNFYPQPTALIFPTNVTPGDGLSSNTVGSSIYLRALGSSWQIVSQEGTWTTYIPS